MEKVVNTMQNEIAKKLHNTRRYGVVLTHDARVTVWELERNSTLCTIWDNLDIYICELPINIASFSPVSEFIDKHLPLFQSLYDSKTETGYNKYSYDHDIKEDLEYKLREWFSGLSYLQFAEPHEVYNTADMVREWKNSGLSVEEFCKNERAYLNYIFEENALEKFLRDAIEDSCY